MVNPQRREHEGTDIPKALNKRVLAFGVPWLAFMFTLLCCVMVYAWVSKPYAFVLLVVSMLAQRWVTKKEPDLIKLAWHWWKHGRHSYDAGRQSI